MKDGVLAIQKLMSLIIILGIFIDQASYIGEISGRNISTVVYLCSFGCYCITIFLFKSGYLRLVDNGHKIKLHLAEIFVILFTILIYVEKQKIATSFDDIEVLVGNVRHGVQIMLPEVFLNFIYLFTSKK